MDIRYRAFICLVFNLHVLLGSLTVQYLSYNTNAIREERRRDRENGAGILEAGGEAGESCAL